MMARGQAVYRGKRLLDVALLVLTSALVVPALGVVALIVLASSGRPVLYRGVRVGRRGDEFRILKFRTMVTGQAGALTTASDDPRVTRIGRHLRRWKLDELPQWINVLRGEMSFVGPRPEVPEYVAMYSLDEVRILSVLPGITDYASIKYRDLAAQVGVTESADDVYLDRVFPEKNRLRLLYVDRVSFGEDLRILGWTALKMMGCLRGDPWAS